MDIDSDTELELALPELGPESPLEGIDVVERVAEVQPDVVEVQQHTGKLPICCLACS